jgi:hypothetical protein
VKIPIAAAVWFKCRADTLVHKPRKQLTVASLKSQKRLQAGKKPMALGFAVATSRKAREGAHPGCLTSFFQKHSIKLFVC